MQRAAWADCDHLGRAHARARGARWAEVGELRAATKQVLSEHGRVQEALRRLYPDLVA